MDQIKWCFKQKNGIDLIKPNLNLAYAYFERAKADFYELKKQNPVWKAIISYYVCYNAFYSLLTRYGIKSEIHSCTLLLMCYFQGIKRYHPFLKQLKENRSNTQYYLKEPENINIKKIKEYLIICENELLETNQQKINELHRFIREQKE